MDGDKIYNLLMEREKQSSTEIEPGLAIPHILVEGQGISDMLIARAKEGIVFDKNKPPVNTAFLLIGSRDERHFHLKTMAIVAQIIQDEHFIEKWLTAKNAAALRDLVLLGQRKRHKDGY